MPTAVLDIDLNNLRSDHLNLENFHRALVLLRVRGKPVGQVTLPVINGRLSSTDLCESALHIAGWAYWEDYLYDFLDWAPTDDIVFAPPRATIAVCTRDRPDHLRSCIEAIFKLPDDGQEIIIVDNCPSSDDTRTIVESYGKIRYIREDFPGASAARNRALREASHPIVAFSDDDAAPDPGWLRALLRNFADPLVVCVTGLTMPVELETDAQELFELHCPFQRGFQRIIFDGTDLKRSPLNIAAVGTSANMAIRKDALHHVGLFDETLGPGTRTCTGEDFEMFYRIISAGNKIIYEPSALSWHRHRRTWDELHRAVYGHGAGQYAFLTCSLLTRREFGAPLIAFWWFRNSQFGDLVRSIFHRPGCKPLSLISKELFGCAAGPLAYFRSRREQVRPR